MKTIVTRTLLTTVVGWVAFSLAAPRAEANHGGIHYRKAQHLVTLLYRGVLFREPDPRGLEAWTRRVFSGGYPALVHVARQFGESSEFTQQVCPNRSARSIVRNLYRVLLMRTPDPLASHWVTLIEQGEGGEAIAGIVGSEEFRDVHGLD